jgi:hypothetical protein
MGYSVVNCPNQRYSITVPYLTGHRSLTAWVELMDINMTSVWRVLALTIWLRVFKELKQILK